MDWKYLFTSFEGRIHRKDFWIGMALLFVANIIVGILTGSGLGAVGTLLYIALIIPSAAVVMKRFHDRGKTGWWTLIMFVPLIGFFWILIDCGILKGEPGDNQYGPDPLGGLSNTV